MMIDLEPVVDNLAHREEQMLFSHTPVGMKKRKKKKKRYKK